MAKPKPPLSEAEFNQVVRMTPLVSVDLVLRDPDGRVLVGLRTNEPAKGTYFVPGGAIWKDERIEHAFARILEVETGLTVAFREARFLGATEHFYPSNRSGEAGYGTHYVVLPYELSLKKRPDITLDDQHASAKWLSPDEILAAPDVHENTKAYFRQHNRGSA